jgi:hypothetical protein
MAFVATGHERLVGSVVPNGHCVAYVREVTGAPPTSYWRRGALVRESRGLASGTAIATFDPNGKYGNHTDKRSHAAVLVAVNTDGLLVWDQWVGQPVQQRTIRFRGGKGDGGAANDGDQFYVIEPVDDGVA